MVGKYIGIIGGSGIYGMDGVEIDEERVVKTPFGDPSDKILLGKMEGVPVAFLSRHGKGHRISPSEINFRANIYALKTLGIDHILSVSAVGSMRKELDRGHIVIADQFIDRTFRRPDTFFRDGIAAHVSFAHPVCSQLAGILYESGKKVGASVHKAGTYVCIEGPMFSSRAESELYRSWGVDVIGMTAYQEAKLAREAEMCYSVMAMVTDYDCWHEEEDNVDGASVIEVMKKNVKTAQEIIKNALVKVKDVGNNCTCNSSLANAIFTNPEVISPEVKKRLEPIIGKYIK